MKLKHLSKVERDLLHYPRLAKLWRKGFFRVDGFDFRMAYRESLPKMERLLEKYQRLDSVEVGGLCGYWGESNWVNALMRLLSFTRYTSPPSFKDKLDVYTLDEAQRRWRSDFTNGGLLSIFDEHCDIPYCGVLNTIRSFDPRSEACMYGTGKYFFLEGFTFYIPFHSGAIFEGHTEVYTCIKKVWYYDNGKVVRRKERCLVCDFKDWGIRKIFLVK